ncbi:MAG: SPFH/Band 7/PHB domain protein [Candidatus Pacebacteria bacterium]|nr:SPFH/Band 7/PHB domain protein [Candidatus Paceibacterota bacterium]
MKKVLSIMVISLSAMIIAGWLVFVYFRPITGLLTFAGLLVIYITLVVRIVRPPERWVIEINLPWEKTTIKDVWEPGFHFLYFPIKPIMYVRGMVYCADKTFTMTMGVDDGNPGDKSLVDFNDSASAVAVQIIMKVIDPIKATYNVDNYSKASLDLVEGAYRKIFASMTLDEAMSDLDRRSDMAKRVFEDINASIREWGVALTNPDKELTILDFCLADDLLQQRQKKINAEKDAAVQVTMAEASKKSTILTAEGQSQATILLQNAEGKGESEKIQLLISQLGLTKEQAIEYLLKLGMIDAVGGSTLIATSVDGNLNTPVGLAQTMFAVNDAQKKQGGKDNK